SLYFLFTHTATTDIYTLSLHDALPICSRTVIRLSPNITEGKHHNNDMTVLCLGFGSVKIGGSVYLGCHATFFAGWLGFAPVAAGDRKSIRLNSSHVKISYAVFCLKKKK